MNPAAGNNQPTPLCSVDTQHDDMIHDAQLDYYSEKLATCSSDRTVKIYDVNGESYQQTAILTNHEGPVWQVAWAHPKFDVILASCGYDGKVMIQREQAPGNWTKIHEYTHHKSSVNSLAFAPYELGLVLACASSDGKISVLEHQDDGSWQARQFVDTNLGCNAVSWAPSSGPGAKTPEGKGIKRLVTGSCDNNVKIWAENPNTMEWVQENMASEGVKHSDWVRDVAWAPSTGLPCNIIASCSEDKKVLIWTQTDANAGWTSTVLHTFDCPVWRVSWSITGNVLAVSSGDHKVTLWKQALDGDWNQISQTESAPM